MNKFDVNLAAFLLLPMLWFSCGQAAAVNQAFEYHADARMRLASGDAVKHAYGYVYVVTDKRGHGMIQVMFSNGTAMDRVQFNAQVKFLDADGELLRVEKFGRRIEAAGAHGAGERQLTKLVDLTEFADVEVDFFLSEIPATTLVANNSPDGYPGH